MWTQELIKSDPHQVLNIKGKDKQMQWNSRKRTDDKQNWQPFPKKVATLLPKLNSEYILNLHKSHITKTCLYNFDPLNPHFYVVKLGFTGVYIIFLISAQNIEFGFSLEPPRRGGSNEYPQSMFWAEIWKISEFFIWKFSVFGGEIFYIFE